MSELKVGDRVWVKPSPWGDDDHTGYAVITRLCSDGLAEIQLRPVLVCSDRLEPRSR